MNSRQVYLLMVNYNYLVFLNFVLYLMCGLNWFRFCIIISYFIQLRDSGSIKLAEEIIKRAKE